MPLPAPMAMNKPLNAQESHVSPEKPRSHVHGVADSCPQRPWPLQAAGSQLAAELTCVGDRDGERDCVCDGVDDKERDAVSDGEAEGGGTVDVWLGLVVCVGVDDPFGGALGL